MARPDISTETLVAYALGDLEAAAAAEVEQALAGSDSLREALTVARTIVETLETDDSAAPPREAFERAVALVRGRSVVAPAPTSPLDAAAAVVASLLFDSRRQPALAGVRGSRESYQLTYRSGAGTVDLDVAPLARGRSALWRVRGQVSDRPAPAPAGRDVVVLGAGTQAESARGAMDEHGLFKLDLGAGEYDLLIDLAPRPLFLPRLVIG